MSEYAKMVALKAAYAAAQFYLDEARTAGMTPRAAIEFLMDVGAEGDFGFHRLEVVPQRPEVVSPGAEFQEVEEPTPTLGQLLRAKLAEQGGH